MSLLKVAIAVFLTFSCTPFALDLFKPQHSPFWWLVVWAAYSGIVAVAFLLATVRYRRWLPAVIVAYVISTLLLEWLFPTGKRSLLPSTPEFDLIRKRLMLDAAFILAAVIAGYCFFMLFINTEGRKYFRIQTELRVAQRLQTNLVPPLSMKTDSLELHGRSIPSSQVRGDLIDAVSIDGTLTCYLADVSGHGIQAGVLMGMVKSATRMNLLKGQSLESLLDDLNRVLPHVKEPNMYVTFACLRFCDARCVEYSLAGHLPIIYYHHQTRTIAHLGIEQFPLGLLSTSYQSARVPVSPGDIFALVTDGFTEVTNSKDEEFGLEGLGQIILEHADKSLTEAADEIIACARKHGRQMDDQTLLLVRVTA